MLIGWQIGNFLKTTNIQNWTSFEISIFFFIFVLLTLFNIHIYSISRSLSLSLIHSLFIISWHKHKSFPIWHETKATTCILCIYAHDCSNYYYDDGGQCRMHTTRISIKIFDFIYSSVYALCAFSQNAWKPHFHLADALHIAIWLICIIKNKPLKNRI